MKRVVFSVLILFLIAATFGCGGSGKMVKAGDLKLKDWVENPPDSDAENMYAVACRTSRDMQIAVDKATTSARVGLASEVEIHISNLRKDFAQEVDLTEGSELYAMYTSTSKTVTDQTLRGSSVLEQDLQKVEEKWNACVLMECSRAETNMNLVDEIKRQEEMYVRFLESEAFKDLEAEVEAYRKFKDDHGQ